MHISVTGVQGVRIYLLLALERKGLELYRDLDCPEMLQVRLEGYFLDGRVVPVLQKSVGIASCLEMVADVGEPNFNGLSIVGVEIHVLESVVPSRVRDRSLTL